MEYISIGGKLPGVSRVVMGCMRIGAMDEKSMDELIDAALASGINAFDHADIYGGGESERRFGNILREHPSLRDRMFIQSKCGIKEGEYDFSREHILSSVDGILKRLSIDSLDLLILHRPDVLGEPEEVAEAFDELKSSGKVRAFGASNMSACQLEMYNRVLGENRFLADQLQLSCAHTLLVDEGFNVNMTVPAGTVRTGGTLEYCRMNGITIQSWSTLQYGFFEGTFLNNREKYPELNRKLDELAAKYGVTAGAIATAFVLRIPGVGQAVIGSTKPARIRELAEAGSITLTHSEWYELYRSAGNRLP